MSEARSAALNAIYEQLSDGKWADGLKVLRKAMVVIPPGEASRYALQLREKEARNSEPPPLEELIRSGRRALTRTALSTAITRGRIETDVGKLERDHWMGSKPWNIRDPEAKLTPVADLAKMLDISDATARGWIEKGFVPAPVTNKAGQLRITPEQVPAWKLVRDAWPGPLKRWLIDPRSLWDTPTQECPHCGGAISVLLTKGNVTPDAPDVTNAG